MCHQVSGVTDQGRSLNRGLSGQECNQVRGGFKSGMNSHQGCHQARCTIKTRLSLTKECHHVNYVIEVGGVVKSVMSPSQVYH